MNQQQAPQDQQQSQQMEASLENRYRAIGIQAVAAAKSVKGAPKQKRNDYTAMRLIGTVTD